MKEAGQTKKKRRTWLWIVIGLGVVVALFVGWRVIDARQQAARLAASLETESYQRRDLSAFIYGTGSVQPSQSAVLTWTTSGTVGEVNISVGDLVQKDDLIIALDPDSLSVDVLQAQIDVINAQNALDELYQNWEADLAQARLDLLNAEDALENLENRRRRMNFNRCSDERLEDLEEAYERAEQVYNFNPDARTLQALNTALANLNFCRSDYSEREIAEADLEIALSDSRVANLRKRVDSLIDGPDPDQETILETRLAIAQSRLDSPLIRAPFNGVVTELSSQIGDVIQAGSTAVHIDNLADLRLNVQISEIDIPFVEIGQPVQLVFDAYFEQVFNGEVREISPVGRTVQGVVEYTVRIVMQDNDQRIKPGMTAAVTIVIKEKQDIFVVPNDAIVSRNGQSHVYVARNGSYEAVPVNLGSYSDFYSEVIEAEINEGELIVLNPPASITGEMPFGGGPRGGFNGFGN